MRLAIALGVCVALGVLGAAKLASGQAPAAPKSTIENLQAAYNGESNAHARYRAFAEKADSEGLGSVASLFRAAARAEEVHARNHAEVIKKMGATPKADIKQPEVKSTKENLEAAIAGETYERDTMYPEFIKQAKGERNGPAIRTFNLALLAEAEHAKLYKAALDGLSQPKVKQSVSYYVCSVCGYTMATPPKGPCRSCFSGADKYEKVD